MSGLVEKVKGVLSGDNKTQEHAAPTHTSAADTTTTTSAPVPAETQNPVPTTASSANALGGIDAAKHKPSVVKEALGAPEITHDYPEQSTHRRHSVNPQEEHLLK